MTDEYAKCPTCGQPLVSGNADTNGRKDKRSKGCGTSRYRRNRVSVAQRVSDDVGDATSGSINVAFTFRGGSYEGKARVVRVAHGGLYIEFPWNGGEKRIQIAKDEVKND